MAKAEAAAMEEEWQRKKNKKKEAKEKKSWEAKAREEEEKRKEQEQKAKDGEFRAVAQVKLANIVRNEKYDVDHPALKKYWQRHVTEEQMQSSNLDDHSTYLTTICWDQSLYPHDNVTPCSNLIWLLRDWEVG